MSQVKTIVTPMNKWWLGVGLAAACALPGCSDDGTAADEATSGSTGDTAEPAGEVAENVYVVGAADDVVVMPGRLVVPRATHPELAARVVGDILVADRGSPAGSNPDGFIRRITRISGGELFEIETEQAYLTEVFREVSFHGALGWSEPGLAVPGPGSAELTPRALDLFTHEFAFSGAQFGPYELKPAEPFSVKVAGKTVNFTPSLALAVRAGKGSFELESQVGLDLDVSLFTGLKQFGWWIGGKVAAEFVTETEMSVELGVSLAGASASETAAVAGVLADWLSSELSLDITREDVAKKHVVGGTVTIHGIPIPYTLSVGLNLDCKLGNIKGSAVARAGTVASGDFKLGSEWNSGQGWKFVRDWSWEPTSERSLTGVLTLHSGCELKPKIELIVAGVAGPNAFMSLASTAEFKAEQTCEPPAPTPKTKVTLGLTSEVGLGVGARLGVVVPPLDIDITLAEAEFAASVAKDVLGPWDLTETFPGLLDGFGACMVEILDCDPFAQDCPAGFKCAAWASGGGSSWDATRCVEVAAKPVGVGAACAVEGSGVSGVDDCALGAMCYFVDEENMGTCVGLCTGSADAAKCPADKVCAIANDGVLNLCLDRCDPLGPGCPADQVCVFNEGAFVCVGDASGSEGQQGQPCNSVNACDPGLFCNSSVAGCEDFGGCCSAFCNTQGPFTCLEDLVCTPWWPEDEPVLPGYEHLGGCSFDEQGLCFVTEENGVCEVLMPGYCPPTTDAADCG